MAPNAFWRVVWKEYRAQRPAWLAVALLTPLAQIGLYLWSMFADRSLSGDVYLATAFVAAAMFMLGSGATIFAEENEAGTLDFLRRLPTSPSLLFGAKSFLAVVLGITLAVLLAYVAEVLFAHGQHEGQLELYVASALVASLELFGWSVAFSLVIRQPLWAAVLGVIVPSALLGIVYPALLESDRVYEMFGTHMSYLAPRTVVAVGLIVVDFVLVRYWYLDRPLLTPFGLRKNRSSVRDDASSATRTATAGRGSSHAVVSYLWLTLRQSWPLLVAIAGVSAAIVLPKLLFQRVIDPSVIVVSMHLSAIACGFATFGFDQFGGNYRFLAEQGTNVRTLWCIRQVVWGSVFLLTMIALYASQPFVDGDFSLYGLYSPVALFVIAQIAGLYQRRFVIAIILPFLALPLVLTWVLLMGRFMLPAFFMSLPILFCFYATWRNIQAWYDDRFVRRDKIWLAALIAVPPLVVLMSLSAYRAVEIPRTDPGFSVVEFQRNREGYETNSSPLDELANRSQRELAAPATREKFLAELDRFLASNNEMLWSAADRKLLVHDRTAPGYDRLYMKLWNDFASNSQTKSASENWNSLDRMLRLLHQADRGGNPWTFSQSTTNETTVLQAVGTWANREDVTASQLSAACRTLTDLEDDQTSGADAIKNAYLQYVSQLSGDADATAASYGYVLNGVNWAPELTSWIPTERERTLRLLNILTALELVQLENCQKLVKRGGRIDSTTLLWQSHGNQTAWSANTITPLIGTTGYFLRRQYVFRISRLRATRLQLAVAAFVRREGKLPASLNDVVDDNLKSVPIDPITGKPFQYFPQGVHVQVEAGPTRVPVPPNTPFLWSTGAYHSGWPLWQMDDALAKFSGGTDDEIAETQFFKAGEVLVLPSPK